MNKEKIKGQIKKFISDKVKLTLFIVILISLLFNILFLANNAHAPTFYNENNNYDRPQVIQRQKEINVEHPFGTKHESYKKYENGEWKTYSNTTALEEHEIEDIRNEFYERQKLMRNHFKKQQKLMNEMWESFYW